jgi:hypothetical protein
VEILRKTVAGSYKCGFYLGIKFKSPLEILFRSRRLGKIIGRINGVATTPVFYMWVAQTWWTFLNTWTSLLHAMYTCDADGSTCITGIMITGIHQEGTVIGEVAGGFDLYDPNDWHQGLGGQIEIPEGFNSQAHMACNVTSFNMTCSRIDFYFGNGFFPGGPIRATDGFSLANNETNEVYLAASRPAGGPDHWRMGFIAQGCVKLHSLGRIDISCVRFVVRSKDFVLPACDEFTPSVPVQQA